MKKQAKHAELSDLLRKYDLKVTPGRQEVLTILESKHVPISAEDIFKKIKRSTIDRATIYRTLASFVEKGIVRTVDLHASSILYELALDHHHHIVCITCGTTEDFEACDVDGISKKVLRKSPKFKIIDRHSLELFGVCNSCSKT